MVDLKGYVWLVLFALVALPYCLWRAVLGLVWAVRHLHWY